MITPPNLVGSNSIADQVVGLGEGKEAIDSDKDSDCDEHTTTTTTVNNSTTLP